MIAIGRRHFLQDGAHGIANQEIFELLLGGDQHWDLTVANIFFRARLVAAHALSENSKPALVISALLVHPCQILASGCYQAGDWSSDSLYESGLLDLLLAQFAGRDNPGETHQLESVAHQGPLAALGGQGVREEKSV